MNIASILTRAVDRYPNREALVFGSKRWTYAEWNRRINRFAQALTELGVRPFDRVAIYLSTDEASVTSYFACQKIGAVVVPMNFRLAAGEVSHILRDSGARLLIYSHALEANVLLAKLAVRSVHDFIAVAGNGASLPEQHFLFETLAEQGDGNVEPGYSAEPDHLSALVYTSGTTGRAKGVMHTHANDVAIAMNCVMEYGIAPTDRALHIAPLYHVGGMQAFFMPHMFVGATNVVEGRYQALTTLEIIEKERITTLFAVPTQIQEVLFEPRFKDFKVSSLRLITTGGAAIAAATMERVLKEFCPNLYNGYGMTEASLTLLLHPRDALSKLGSCGKPTLISNVRIVPVALGRDVHPEESVACNEIGQLIVQGPQMMSGYWNNRPETDKKIKNGWLYTSDLFSRDEDGYFTFHGRADDMIVSGGENIYPREVEEVLYRCAGVKEAAVVGLPDEKWGSAVTAFIVRSDSSLTREAVDDFCKTSGLIAAFKRPRRIEFVDELPINPSGKVLKRELLSRFSTMEKS
ncbi:class I adenylate-forming enzyme family protein [Rhodoferax sp. PAMC 29310]|uniref:class I adenylate-forming enzyme family protein n=1 Tax=Rhodoferax sp. PAMC 29310 TaxID=2822760 RepID=UPI001B32121A|nr:AMP-binding protein [Rhodoferax sp. PAMC 29310]